MKGLNINTFIFAPRYRLLRHAVFWVVYTVLTAYIFSSSSRGLWTIQRNIFQGFIWLPLRILYCYPLMYWAIPKYLLKGRYWIFGGIILFWFIAGWFLNYLFRAYFFIPFQKALNMNAIVTDPWSPGSFLLITTAAGLTCLIVLFKYWFQKQQEWMQAEKEKVTAELQLLKAQVHPHFLFNTLNNIYSFSLKNSPKAPNLILKLSSLLSYMLYDCKAEEVLLEKEINIMRDYIDLEKERYGNKIDISWISEGDFTNKMIAPLLLLPFLENAFKHGTSEQLEKPWLSVDLKLTGDILKCKVVNSKELNYFQGNHGIGILNVKRRLAHIYPERHELKISDEGDFFMVSLMVMLAGKEKEQREFPDESPVDTQKIVS